MKTSAARRVHQILQRAVDCPVPQPTPALAMWARVFGIEYNGSVNHPPPDAEDAVLRLLGDVRSEIAEVGRGPHSDELLPLVKPIVSAAQSFTATSHLVQDWTQVKTNILRPEIMVGWWWAAVHFPAIDDAVNEQALDELRSSLADLESAAAAEDVPAELRRFVKKQADTIRDALQRYTVAGIEPMQDALSQSLGEAVRDQEEVVEAIKAAPKSSAGVMKKMQDVWRVATRIAGDLAKLKTGFLMITDAYRKVLPALQHFKDAIGS